MAPAWIIGMLAAAGWGASPTMAALMKAECRREAVAHYGAGIWQLRRDRLLSASKSLERASKLDPAATAPPRELIAIYQTLGRENAAIRVARKVLETDPQDVDAAHSLARLLHDGGEPQLAVKTLKTAANLGDADRPDKSLARFRDLARLLEATGDVAGAEAAHIQALVLFSEDRAAVLASGLYTRKEIEAETVDTLERLGRVQVVGRKFEAAAESFRRANDLSTDAAGRARYEWNLARLFHAKSEPHAAADHLTAYLRYRPQSAPPYELLTDVLRQAGRAHEIVPRLRQYHREDPKNEPLRVVLAVELARHLATRPQADQLLAEPVRQPINPELIRRVVGSFIETGRVKELLVQFDGSQHVLFEPFKKYAAARVKAFADVLRAEGGWADVILRRAAEDLREGITHDAQTWHIMGTLAERQHRLDLAQDFYRAALRNVWANAGSETEYRLIEVLALLQRPAEVVVLCREWLPIARWTGARFNIYLSHALAELGRADEAIASADAALEPGRDVTPLSFRLNKISVLGKLRRGDEAIALGQKLLEEATGHNDRLRIRYALAQAYRGAGRQAQAEIELRAMLDDDPDDISAAHALGQVLTALGRDLTEAERLIRRAIEMDRMDRHRAGNRDGENGTYLASLGWVLFQRRNLPDARDWLMKATATWEGANDALAWERLGDIHSQLQEAARARAAWQRAAKLYESGFQNRLSEVKRKLAERP